MRCPLCLQVRMPREASWTAAALRRFPLATRQAQASANLVNWTKLAARTSGGTTFHFTDTQATKNGARFYRLVVP